MPVPSSISDLSTTPSLNSPAGTESPSTVDDYLRTFAAFIKQVDGGAVKAADLAAPGGSVLVGYDGGTVQAVLDDAKPLADYAALRAYTGRATGVRVTQDGLAGFFQRDAIDTTSADNGGTIIVDASGRRWKRSYTGSADVKWFGAIGDGVSDDRSILIDTMSKCAASSVTLFISDGVYACSDWVPLPSGLRMVFAPGAIWKLTGSTALGGFVCGGSDINLNQVAFSDVDIYGMRLDCNNLAGENGINAINAEGVRFYDPKVFNTTFSGTTQGGKAFQFEGATVDGLHVFNPYIENCTIGINSHGDPTGGTEKVRHISYYNVVMRNVDVPFNVDGQFLNPENGIPDNMSTFVHGANLYNCGKLTFSGATSTGGGIICGDRGYGLKISGLRVVNSTAYGGIGGLVCGTLFNVELTDAKIEAPSLTAIYNFEPVGYGSPSHGDHPCTIVSRDVTVIAGMDYVVKGFYAGKVGKCLFDNTVIDSSVATLTGICDLSATTNGLGVLDLALADLNYKRSGRQSLAKLYAVGNGIGVCQPEYEEGSWTPTDASGAGLSFTLPDTCWYVRQGRLVTAVARIVYPTTANTANATIGGLPFAAGNFSANAGVGAVSYATESTLARAYVIATTSTALLSTAAGGIVQNVDMSGDTLYIVFTYLAA